MLEIRRGGLSPCVRIKAHSFSRPSACRAETAATDIELSAASDGTAMAGATNEQGEAERLESKDIRRARANSRRMNTCAKIAGGVGVEFHPLFEIPEILSGVSAFRYNGIEI
jgi:hypothetical protein